MHTPKINFGKFSSCHKTQLTQRKIHMPKKGSIKEWEAYSFKRNEAQKWYQENRRKILADNENLIPIAVENVKVFSIPYIQRVFFSLNFSFNYSN